MVDAVNINKFGENYNNIMTYIAENKNLLTYDAKDIALKINYMADGLFNGMREHDGKSACTDDMYWKQISTLKTKIEELTKLAYENKIPSLSDLKCSNNWWIVDANSVFYGEYHNEKAFYNLENESFTNDILVVQETSFALAG